MMPALWLDDFRLKIVLFWSTSIHSEMWQICLSLLFNSKLMQCLFVNHISLQNQIFLLSCTIASWEPETSCCLPALILLLQACAFALGSGPSGSLSSGAAPAAAVCGSPGCCSSTLVAPPHWLEEYCINSAVYIGNDAQVDEVATYLVYISTMINYIDLYIDSTHRLYI